MYDNFILRKTDGGNIAGYIWPVEDPDKVVCLVHGIGEYAGRYERVAEAFHERNIAMISMDLRGHGLSAGKRGHCAPRASVLEDITKLIEYAEGLYPGKPLVLYGHSMGGNITLDYRSRGELNDKAVGYIISAPWIRLVRSVPGALLSAVKIIAKIKPDLTMGSGVDETKLGNTQSVGAYVKNQLVHDKISLATAIDGFEIGEAIEKGTLPDNGRAKDIPLLLMHGDQDAICDVNGSRALASRLEDNGDNYSYVEWPGLYHEIHNGGPESLGDEVIATMADWISEL